VPKLRLAADRGRPRRGGDLGAGGCTGHRAALSPPLLSPRPRRTWSGTVMR